MIYGVNRYHGGIVTRIKSWPDEDTKGAAIWAENRGGLDSKTVRTLHHLPKELDIDGIDLEKAAFDIEKAAID